MTDLREQLRDQRIQNRLAVERIRAARLQRAEHRERHRQLSESLTLDWVTPYADMLDMWGRGNGDPILSGPTAYWNRRFGKNWPIHQTEQELALFRAPSRLLCATSDDAIALVNGVSAYVIGSGYTYRVAKRRRESTLPPAVLVALQAVVDEVLEANEWQGGEQFGVETECFWRSLEDGEFLILSFPQADGSTEFRIPEPEQLTQPPGSNYYDWLYGVCTDPGDVQRPLAYWFQWGDTPGDGEEYDPDRVTHFKRNGRRSQKRGMPDFAFQLHEKLSLAGKLRLNLVDTATRQAAIPYVMQHANGSQEDVQAFRDAEADYQTSDPLTGQTQNVRRPRRGEGQDIPEGMTYVDGPGAPYSDKHLAILQEALRGGVARWNGFEWLISSNAATNNLPVDLSAESPFVRRVLQEQNRYRGAFKKPVWNAARHHVETVGLVVEGRAYSWEELARELDLLVEAPSPETRNKLEETQRAQIEIPLGLDSPQRYMQTQGRDPDQIQADSEEWARTHPQQQQQPAATPAAGGPTPPKPGPARTVGDTLESWLPPEVVLRALLEDGFSGTITDKRGAKRHYENGREVKGQPEGGGGGKPAAAGLDHPDVPSAERVTADALPEVAKAFPEATKDPKTWAKVKATAGKVRDAVYGSLVRATPYMLPVAEQIGDTADDWNKWGFNPAGLSGTAGPQHADPINAALGISTQLFCKISAVVLAKGIVWAKGRLSKPKVESLLESIEPDQVREAADWLADLFDSLLEASGVEAKVDRAKVLAAVEAHAGA